jgi:hypothetical protein
MELSKVAGRFLVIFLITIAGAIGGVSGALITGEPWQAIVVAALIGFGVYVTLLYVVLATFFAAMKRMEAVENDK